MSTLGGLIRYSLRRKSRRKGYLPKAKWIEKMKKEGTWKDYKLKNQ